jgi:hypothetical protein
MATVEERYATATAYVRRAIATVEDRGVGYIVDPTTGIIEWYAGRTKTAQPRNELARIEARWLRATNGGERAAVARDAELLADRVEENLPGAPQDRQRTNLYPGETPKGTPATTYADEVRGELGRGWGWVKTRLSDGASNVGTWLLVGGGVVLSWKALDYLRERERQRALRAADEDESQLNAELEHVADEGDAATEHDEDEPRNGRGSYYVRMPDTDLYFRVVRDHGGRSVLVVPLSDEARDAVADHPAYAVTMPDGSYGEAYHDDIARYERVSRVPRWVLS